MSDDGRAGRAAGGRAVYEAASMYYAQGETMEVIARHLGVSRSTVSRLLARARAEGVVRIELVRPGGAGGLEARFESELGVRAHIQHLNAYGDTDELVNPVVDKRAKFISPRGKAPTVFDLAGTWASDKKYGEKLDALLSRMERTERM